MLVHTRELRARLLEWIRGVRRPRQPLAREALLDLGRQHPRQQVAQLTLEKLALVLFDKRRCVISVRANVPSNAHEIVAHRVDAIGFERVKRIDGIAA